MLTHPKVNLESFFVSGSIWSSVFSYARTQIRDLCWQNCEPETLNQNWPQRCRLGVPLMQATESMREEVWHKLQSEMRRRDRVVFLQQKGEAKMPRNSLYDNTSAAGVGCKWLVLLPPTQTLSEPWSITKVSEYINIDRGLQIHVWGGHKSTWIYIHF